MPAPLVIKTERLILRKPRKSDVAAICAYAREKDMARYTRMPTPYRKKDAESWIADSAKGFGKTAAGFLIEFDGNIVGSVGLKINEVDNNAELGYVIAQKYRRKGIATEAAQAVVSYGFNVLKLHRIGVGHLVDNKKSEGVTKKLRFKKEGILRGECRTGNGKYHDRVVYSLLKKEWKK